MARITVEDCLEKVDNRFKLIHIASKRVRQLRKGVEPLVDSKNTDTVVALREIAAGAVYESEYGEDQFLLENTATEQPSLEKDVQEMPEEENPDKIEGKEASIEE